jgi:hypothetical protein
MTESPRGLLTKTKKTMGRFITARFKSACAETGKTIQHGEPIYYDGKAYCQESKIYKDRKDAGQTFAHITANENAYFDNFCSQNNI